MDTNPVAEVAESPEAQLEAIFAKQSGEAKPEPVDDEAPDEPSETTPDDADAADEGQADDVVADDVELTIGEEVRKLTKAELAEIVAKRDSFQRDYTQKTQEVAEQRKSVSDREQYLQAREIILNNAFKEAAEVQSLESQLAQFETLDWNSLITNDPQQALQLNLARQQLQTNLDKKQKALQEVVGSAQAAANAHKAKQTQLGLADLQRRIGPITDEARATLGKAAQELGYSEAEMMSPAALHALHLASKYMALQKAKPLTDKKVANAKPMQAPAARSTNQTIEQARREEMKARVRKTGRSDDAEAYLARLFETKRKR